MAEMNWQITFPPIPKQLARHKLPPGSYLAYCPAHHDRSGLLLVTPEGNRVGLHCRCGCTRGEIIEAAVSLVVNAHVNEPAGEKLA